MRVVNHTTPPHQMGITAPPLTDGGPTPYYLPRDDRVMSLRDLW